jgi:hypothetical protein
MSEVLKSQNEKLQKFLGIRNEECIKEKLSDYLMIKKFKKYKSST